MSIRVQCGGCGSVMTVRDDYAGTQRKCPKCKGEFSVPTLEESRRAATAAGPSSAAGDEFDAVAFLTGESGGKSKSGSAKPPVAAPVAEPEFDPLDVLGGSPPPAARGPVPTKSESTGKGPTAAGKPDAGPVKPSKTTPAEAKFDPADMLSDSPPKPPAGAGAPVPPSAPPSPPAAAPTTPEKPQPRRPSWAKPPTEPEKNDWDQPAPAEAPAAPAAPEKPQPRRPSWAKPLPAAEKNDWDNPPAATETPAATTDAAAAPEPPKPKRPAWAKPLPGDAPAAGTAGAVAEDASPAAKAAADAMAASVAGVSGDNPALQAAAQKRPWIRPADIAAWFRQRIPLLIKTVVAAALLFAAAWLAVRPGGVEWKVIGKNESLSPVPVTGRLTVDGKPMAGARILFHPRGPRHRSSEGVTDGEGRFVMQFCDGEDGAPPGPYRVQMQLIGKDGADAGVAAEKFLREQVFVVPAGGGEVDVAINTKAPK